MYEADRIYHIYNQSNNFEKLYRSEENYLFFIKKIRTHLKPIGSILCYCLMPDHFHILFKLNDKGAADSTIRKTTAAFDLDATDIQYQQQISHQIKIMLSSYTRAFNRQHNRRGGLFRPKTKVKPVYLDFMREEDVFIMDGDSLLRYVPYLRRCFEYIHQNPVRAKLVAESTDWHYSSAIDFAGARNGTLCDYKLVQDLLGITRGED